MLAGCALQCTMYLTSYLQHRCKAHQLQARMHASMRKAGNVLVKSSVWLAAGRPGGRACHAAIPIEGRPEASHGPTSARQHLQPC